MCCKVIIFFLLLEVTLKLLDKVMRAINLGDCLSGRLCFNAIINNKEIKELELTDRRFTWLFNQEDPILAKLDRFLVSMDWKRLFILVVVRSFQELFQIILILF